MGLAVGILGDAMEALASKRPIFHSEADFQHALAWNVQVAHPTARIRLEKRVSVRPNIELDLLIEIDGLQLGVELKYPRRAMTTEVGGELFTLSTGADDHGRYFAVEDVARLEQLVAAGVIESGALILLSNVANVWAPPASRRPVLYDAPSACTMGTSSRAQCSGATGARQADDRPGRPEQSRYEAAIRSHGATTRR